MVHNETGGGEEGEKKKRQIFNLIKLNLINENTLERRRVTTLLEIKNDVLIR